MVAARASIVPRSSACALAIRSSSAAWSKRRFERILAPLERREVEEAVTHGALHLERALADQKNLGRVRGHALHLGAGRAESFAFAEEGAEPVRIDGFSTHARSSMRQQDRQVVLAEHRPGDAAEH